MQAPPTLPGESQLTRDRLFRSQRKRLPHRGPVHGAERFRISSQSRYTRGMRGSNLFLTLVFTTAAQAQWQMQDSHTTADLRGIHSLDAGVAWASGTNGTVLRTEDAGAVWQLCAMPPGAEKLDFRGIQGFDHNTAIVMSSGPGDQSRLYKTSDGCQTWKLLLTNPDKEGFWDALVLNRLEADGWLLGDPVNGHFTLLRTHDKGETWVKDDSPSLQSLTGEGGFAASNSSLVVDDHGRVLFGTGGSKVARVFQSGAAVGGFQTFQPPLAAGTPGAGVFSIAFRTFLTKDVVGAANLVAVGGDYTKPNESQGTATLSVDDGQHWVVPQTLPHGYRSSVAYDKGSMTWVTVGPNGTDISTDDGRSWRALKPGTGDAPDADQHWNALSLPYVVGPHGRIATLRLESPKK